MRFFGEHFQFTAAQGQTGCALTLHLQCNFQRGMSKIIPVKQRFDGYIFQMHGGDGVQPHAAEDAGEAEEVLIFAPAAACPLEYLRRQFVFSLFQVRCQFKPGRRKGILAITDKSSVQPYGNTALCSLERNKKVVFPSSVPALQNISHRKPSG